MSDLENEFSNPHNYENAVAQGILIYVGGNIGPENPAGNPSSRSLVKSAKLPTTGKIRFIPRKADIGIGRLLKKNGGYIDRFGNTWKKGPSRTPGEPFEWDVQLSPKGRASIGHLSKSGKHVNVSLKGKVTH